MSVNIQSSGRVVVAYLSGEIDHHSAKQMREQIDAALNSYMPSMLALDFKDVTFMDSSGIGLIMGRYRLLSKTAAQLCIINAPEHIYKIMKLAGIEKLAKLSKGEVQNETGC